MINTVFSFIVWASFASFWILTLALLYSTYIQRIAVAFLTARFKSLEKQREVFAMEHDLAKKEMGV